MMNEHIENMEEETLFPNEAPVKTEPEKDTDKEPADLPSPTEEVVEVVETPQEPKEGAGVVLKRERQAQGLSLDIVHEATKIPMDVLRAIEEGYKIRMLSPFYYKGFLKMYAGYLGIDVSQVIEDYKEEELPQHIDQNVEEIQAPLWITNFFTRRRKQQIVIAGGIILSVFLFFKIIGFFMGLAARAPVKKNVPTIESAKKEVIKSTAVKKETKRVVEEKRKEVRQETPKIAAPKAIPKVESRVQPVPKPRPVVTVATPVPAPVSVPVMRKEINLTVRAKQNSWLRVRADGTIVFQSTLRLGAVETWMADDEIEISGKNIDQLEFELNGKMIGTLGRKDRNAKKVVITKDGLSVKN